TSPPNSRARMTNVVAERAAFARMTLSPVLIVDSSAPAPSVASWPPLPQESVADATRIEGGPFLVRKLVVVREEVLDLLLDGHEQPDVPGQEIDRASAFLQASLVGVHA